MEDVEFRGSYSIDTQEQAAVYMCSFDGIRRSNYFGEEQIRRAEVEGKSRERLRVRKG